MNDTALKQIDGLTVKETAYVLKVAPQTVYGWCVTGKIEFFRVVGSIRIKKASIDKINNTEK